MSFFCFRRIMDGLFYVEILETHFPEVRRTLESRWTFQQDNNPKHTSHVAKNFLNNHALEVLEWPSNSPDLNPIENLWNIIKENVKKQWSKNLNNLERFMMDEWKKILESILANLVASM